MAMEIRRRITGDDNASAHDGLIHDASSHTYEVSFDGGADPVLRNAGAAAILVLSWHTLHTLASARRGSM